MFNLLVRQQDRITSLAIDANKCIPINTYDCIVLAVNQRSEFTLSGQKLDQMFDQQLNRALCDLNKKPYRHHWIRLHKQDTNQAVLLVRCPNEICDNDYRNLIKTSITALRSKNAQRVLMTLPELSVDERDIYNVAINNRSDSWKLVNGITTVSDNLYRFYLKSEQRAVKAFSAIDYSVLAFDKAMVKRSLAYGQAISIGTAFAKNVNNQPGNYATPTFLAEAAIAIQDEYKDRVQVTVLDKAQIEVEGLTGLLAVSKGSIHEPRFIVAEYLGNPDSAKRIAVVGKGITFDSGGLDIKPSALRMHLDKSGAGSALGWLVAAVEAQLEVNLVVIIPTCENMPGVDAYRPGDIITTYSGLKVEVTNTDAEGRIILSDGIGYAIKHYGSDLEMIVDIATLTGSAGIAVGEDLVAFMSNSRELASAFSAAGRLTGDYNWELPLWHPYAKKLTHGTVANIKNAVKGAGTIMAGLYLQANLQHAIDTYNSGNLVPFLHLDIASVDVTEGKEGYWLSTGRPIPSCFALTLGKIKKA